MKSDRRGKFRYRWAAAGDLSENQHGAILRYGEGKPTTRGKEEETPTGPEWRQMEMKACGKAQRFVTVSGRAITCGPLPTSHVEAEGGT